MVSADYGYKPLKYMQPGRCQTVDTAAQARARLGVLPKTEIGPGDSPI